MAARAQVGNLYTTMDLDSSRFTTEIKKVQAQTAAMASSVDRSMAAAAKASRAFMGVLGGLGVGIGVGAIVNLGRQTLQFADDLATAADQAGVSLERYQTLKEGLRELEISTEQTDKTLKSLTDTLGAVQSGTAAKGVTDALDRMGITTRILSREIGSADELLDAIAGSAGKFSTSAQFTTTVVDILGKKLGVDLAAALRDGGVALTAAEQKFRDTGLVIDETMNKKLADANEAIDKFATRSTNSFTIWAGQTVAAFQKAQSAFEEWRDRRIINSPLSSNADQDAAIGRQGARVLDAAAARNAQERKNLDDLLGRMSPDSEAYKRIYSNYVDQFGEGPEITVTGKRKPFAGKIDAPKALKAAAVPKGPSEREAYLADHAEMARAKESFLAFPGNKLSDLYPDFPTGSDFADLFDIPAMDIDTSGLDYIQEQMREAGRMADRFTGDLASGLADSLIYGDKLGDVLSNTFKRAGAELLSSGIFDILKSVGQGNSIGAAFKSSFGGFFADGGFPPVGKMSVVGERGPELFIPGVSGAIIPNHALKGGGGGGGPTYNVTVNAPNGVNRQEVVGMVIEGVRAATGASANMVRSLSRPRLPGAFGS